MVRPHTQSVADFSCTSERLPSGWAVVVVSGDVDLLSAPTLRVNLLAAVKEYSTNLVVDMTGVTFIDSSGLGALVAAWRRARAEGGSVRLAGMRDHVRRVFDLTSLDRIFSIYNTVDAATRDTTGEPRPRTGLPLQALDTTRHGRGRYARA